VLESAGGVAPADESGGLSPTPIARQSASATYESSGPQAARIPVNTTSRSVVLIRNAYDPGWHATVDGRPARIWPADYLVQGVIVPPGRHTVVLRYGDDTIGFGLLGSGLAVAALVAMAYAFRRRE
jgi:uncharacterized membrane protein YfhO